MSIQGIGSPQPNQGLMGLLAGLAGGVQAFHQGQQQKQQEAQQKQEFETNQVAKKQEHEMNDLAISDAKQKQQAEMAQATIQRGQTALGAIFKNGNYAADPAMIKAVTEMRAAQGLPAPELKKDGKLNVDDYRKEVTELDQKQLGNIMGLPSGQRKALLDGLQRQGYKISKDMYTNQEVVSAKDQAKFMQVKGLIGHYSDEKTWNAQRNAIRSKYYDELGELIPAKTSLLAADTAKSMASASAIQTTANASMIRAQAYATNVSNIMKRFQASPNGNLGAVRTLLSTSTGQLGQLRTSLNDARKNLTTLLTTTPDLDDPTVQQATQTVQALEQQVGSAEEADQQLRAEVSQNPQVSAHLSNASGMSVTPVNNSKKPAGKAPSGTPPGDYEIRGRKGWVDAQGNYGFY